GPLLEGVHGQVDEHRDGTRDDEAGGVVDDVHLEARGLEQAGRLGERRLGAGRTGGDRDGGGRGVIQRAVDDDDGYAVDGAQFGGRDAGTAHQPGPAGKG